MIVLMALGGVIASGCGLYEAYQEVRDLETVLKDNDYANPQINISVEVRNDETTRTITAKVDRPRNAGTDQQIATKVADLIMMNYSGVRDLEKIDIELAGNGPAAKLSLPPADWRDLVRDSREPPGIATAVLAKNVTGSDFEPVDVTTDFPPEQKTFHAVIRVRNLAADTTVRGVWTALETHGVAPPNTEIVATDTKAEGTRRLHLTMEPNAGSLPKGQYKLDVFVADKLERTLPFTVAGG